MIRFFKNKNPFILHRWFAMVFRKLSKFINFGAFVAG